jgi:membrane protein
MEPAESSADNTGGGLMANLDRQDERTPLAERGPERRGPTWRRILRLFRSTWSSWSEDKAPRLSAALAYYTVFSIPPLLVLLTTMAGWVFGREAVQGYVLRSISHVVGPQGALAVEDMLRSTDQRSYESIIAAIIGVVTLILGASGVFGQLKDALNTLWEVEPVNGRGRLAFLRQYVFSMMMLLGTGFLLIVSLAASAALAALGDYLGRTLPGGHALWQVANFGISVVVIAVLFAILFKFIPDGWVAWRDALIGGAVTSLLFTGGEMLIGYYLGRTNVGSAFGAAGSLIVVLAWVYYSSTIFFFGAEFTKSYAMEFGDRVRPDPHAVPVTAEARRQQGLTDTPAAGGRS